MKIKNRKPEVYFGLHFCPGVCEYPEKGQDFRVLIDEQTAKEMDPTFKGLPVYVGHVEEVDFDKIQEEADGYVIRSFYNPCDGMHWAEFVIVSERGHEAVNKGLKLSNAYSALEFGPGGQRHAVDYAKKVNKGEYLHLAIVDNPRYEQSVILTPEDFKQYNENKKLELEQLTNAKGKPMKLKFWKREKVENSKDIDLENLVVELPVSKKEMTLSEAVASADKFENMQGYANGDHMVKVGEEEMSVNDLAKKYGEVCNKMAEMENAESEEEESEGEELENEEEEETKEEEETPAPPKKVENSKIAEGKTKGKKGANFENVMNAERNANGKAPEVVDLMMDKVARGKAKYGQVRNG